jgi:hypothetical protein
VEDTTAMEVEALCWLRFGKKLPLVCTEGGYWNADVIGMNDEFSIEIEIKRSKQDFKRDFSTKLAKHYLYNNAEDAPSRQTPNYFYFYVPASLEEAALEILKEQNSKAGLAVYSPVPRALDGRHTYVSKRATKLHDKPPSPGFRKTVLQRMGSELCGRYIANRDLQVQIAAQLAKLNQDLINTFKDLSLTPDYEEERDSASS